MPITGFYIPRLGPRLVAAIGGTVVGIGYVLASFANNIWLLVIGYGGIAGTGIGMAYGVPMAVVARWFPERKGLAVGLTIIGFGLSPLITAPLANYLIGVYTVRPTLRFLGIIFALMVLAIAAMMKLPPKDWIPPQSRAINSARNPANYPRNILASRSFYGLWICYGIGSLSGLSAIGISSPVGEELIRIDGTVAASSVSLFAVFNGVSRPLFGWLADRYQPHLWQCSPTF